MSITDFKAKYLFPPDIRNEKRFKGFAGAINAVWDGVYQTLLERLKILDLDNATEEMLDAFAVSYNFAGYEYCTNLAKKRAFAKEGVELKRYSGTPYAVKRALELIGFTNVIIHENSSIPTPTLNGLYKLDGSLNLRGSTLYEGYYFEVSADNMTANGVEKARKVIYAYKNPEAYLNDLYDN